MIITSNEKEWPDCLAFIHDEGTKGNVTFKRSAPLTDANANGTIGSDVEDLITYIDSELSKEFQRSSYDEYIQNIRKQKLGYRESDPHRDKLLKAITDVVRKRAAASQENAR